MTEAADTLNVAHRGARSLAPENTLAAAQAAFDAGSDMWELDVRLTADGELLVMHDADLTRTSDAQLRFPERQPWRVSDFTLREICSLDCGSWFGDTDPFGQIVSGVVSQERVRQFRNERAPTLREALEFTLERDWRVMLELKDLGEAAAREVTSKAVALIDHLGMAQRVLVSSFNHEYLKAMRSLDPHIATGALTVRPLVKPVSYLATVGAQAYNPMWSVLSGRTIRKLGAAGLSTYVWTVNSPRRMLRLIRWGVTGIITDFPQRLANLLA